MRASVAVLGLGPAGRSLTHRLGVRGVDVVAVDVAPGRTWRPTYAAWSDELPAWVPAEVVATTSPARAWAVREHTLRRTYAVLDTARLQQALGMDPDRVLTGHVATADFHTVVLDDGRCIEADVVLDARGSRPDPARAQQTALGVVVSRAQAAPLEPTWFMDWRRDNDAAPDATPSFLYVVALDDDRVLLEETCLVGRPALGLDELRRRLHARLAARGVRLTGDEPEEKVRFSVEAEPPADVGGPVAVGARGGLMHPATGYSVATSLLVAERLSAALAGGASTRTAVTDALWNRRAKQVQALRAIGLTTLLRLPPDGVVRFFDAFFALPPALQTAYLSRRDRPAGTLAAMAAMAVDLPPSLSKVAVTSAFARR